MNVQDVVLSHFIVPVALLAGAVLALAVLGVLVYALVKPAQLRRGIEGHFRRPRRERPLDAGHYYRAYWHTK